MGLLEDLQHAFNVDGHQPLNAWSDVANELSEIIVTYPGVGSKNYIINGSMDIAQRGASFAAVADGTYTLDRWKYYKSGDMVHTITQDTDVPTGEIFTKSLKIDCTTVDSSIAAGDYCTIVQQIEGNVLKSLVGKSATLSFWVKATRTGTYCVSFKNSGADRTYIAEYTISQSDTWEYKKVAVTFNYSGGTWDYTTGVGASLQFSLACGSTYQAAPNSWQTGNYIATANQVNATDSTDNNFWLTGVMLNEGTVAAPFQMFGGSFDSELSICERYYQKTYALTTAPATNTSNGVIWIKAHSTQYGFGSLFRKRMRVAATVTLYSKLGTAKKISDISSGDIGTVVTAATVTETNFTAVSDSGSGLTAGATYQYHYTADAEL